MTALAVGQVWRENDDRYRITGASPYRHVLILKVEGTVATIQGLAPFPVRMTRTAVSRFGAPGKTGFTFVNDGSSSHSS